MTLDDMAIRRKRLIYRSWHRGTREMDLILGRFADRHIHDFSEEELEKFEEILGFSDPDLYNWLSGQEAMPAALALNAVLEKLCRSCGGRD